MNFRIFPHNLVNPRLLTDNATIFQSWPWRTNNITMTIEYKKKKIDVSITNWWKKNNNLQEKYRKNKIQTFSQLGRRFGSRASQAAGPPPAAHHHRNHDGIGGGGPAAEFAHRPNDSSTSLCVCVCVQAGPARHVAKPWVRARTHRHTVIHNKTMCSGSDRARLSHRYQTPPPYHHNDDTTITSLYTHTPAVQPKSFELFHC